MLKEAVKMDKIVEKIADHFNNPEMADRVLCVKIREDGWEKLEAASLLKHIRSQSKPSDIEDVEKQNSDTNCGTQSDTNCAPVETDKKKDSAYQIENINREKELKVKVRRAKCKKQDHFLSRKQGQGLKQNSNTEKKIDDSLSTQSGSQEFISNSNKSEKDSENKEIESPVLSSVNENALESQSEQNSLATVFGCTHQIGVTDATATLKDTNTSEDLNSTVIREHQIYVHSFWLSLNSSFFRSLFYSSGMKETKDKQVSSDAPSYRAHRATGEVGVLN